MAFYVLRKLAFFIAAVFVASIAIFLLIRAAGGNVAAIVLGKDATAEAIEALVRSYGLDRPLIVQYFDWIAKLFQGDLGRSFRTKEAVADLVVGRLMMNLSSSFDHRVVDGQVAAQFIQAIRTQLESPAMLFID